MIWNYQLKTTACYLVSSLSEQNAIRFLLGLWSDLSFVVTEFYSDDGINFHCDGAMHTSLSAVNDGVRVYWCVCVVDIDECAAGQIAQACRQHGVCDGFQPEGNWTCACNPGYELIPNRTSCKRQYSFALSRLSDSDSYFLTRISCR